MKNGTTPKWLEQYEPGVAAHLEYPKLTLGQVLHETSRKYPDHTAFIYLDQKWTYREFNALVSKMANVLIELGLNPGDTAGIYLPNSPQFLIAYYGILRSGGIAVPINPMLSGEDLAFIIKDAQLKVIVAPVEAVQLMEQAKTPKLKIISTALTGQLDPASNPAAPGALSLEELLTNAADTDPQVPIDHTAIANLQYTGGTTGRSKGAVLTHFNLLANAIQFREWFKNVYTDGDGRFLGVIPFFHIYGLTTTINSPILTGSSIILHSRFDINEIMQSINKYKPNLFMGVPAMYAAIAMRDNQGYDLSSIRACVSGSSPLPPAVQKRFEEVTGGKLVEGYGLSECSPVVTVTPIYGTIKPGSIGVPISDTQVKIVDPQTGEEITTSGEIGELLVKGPQVMQGYWNNPEETALVLTEDGWLHTGDLVYMDDDGYIYIADRLKDMIIMGGEKIYPRELEDFFYTHPAVKEVAVTGIPHPLRGEVPKAFVVLKEGAAVTEKELRQYCLDHLSKFKVPKIQIIDALPRNAVGKVLRRLLREEGL
ncbi:MAG TPA: long-chain fatty acid--CoA ligase [Firmicutes bacterium]|uniref:Long-chain fatty acid--CoA ligase n=1 Tax=Capillibacterium thermochitinicola TaxID=2699427 RepID=A0A8J6I103_9FIRM|nr:long-chain fatty acid--CoA ligase [Capillibacterium thermochitinicola]MBA2132998.1 long-chain fatty acid--CoA ligase [Capillibacterium thermochitinicola]HHW11470.1 long-chain fatty acid--CoA ligase [Bacillota bacterium]